MVIENVTRRVMYIIREEYENIIREPETQEQRLATTPSASPADRSPSMQPADLTLPPVAADSGDTDNKLSPPISITKGDHDTGSSLSSTPEDISPLKKTRSAVNPHLSGLTQPELDPVILTAKTQDRLWVKGKWKAGVIAHITEYIQELKEIRDIISDQAKEHLYAGEVVLTLGYSHIVEAFIKRAIKEKFEVIVAEGSPTNRGHMLAKNLSAAGIKTTLIPDSAIFAIMSRVNKVLLGAYAVLADGGIIAEAGTHMAAMAAKAHRTPLVVLTGLYKLSPVFPINIGRFAAWTSPAPVMPFNTVHRTNLAAQQSPDAGINHLYVRNPQCDYVPPDLIHTYVTNNGAVNPSYTYRLLAELYNPEDYEL